MTLNELEVAVDELNEPKKKAEVTTCTTCLAATKAFDTVKLGQELERSVVRSIADYLF